MEQRVSANRTSKKSHTHLQLQDTVLQRAKVALGLLRARLHYGNACSDSMNVRLRCPTRRFVAGFCGFVVVAALWPGRALRRRCRWIGQCCRRLLLNVWVLVGGGGLLLLSLVTAAALLALLAHWFLKEAFPLALPDLKRAFLL